MAIEKKQLRDVPASIRNIYQKAVGVIANNGLDYGIELLKSVVKAEPGFIDARNALRSAERAKIDKMGGFAKFLATMKSNKYIIKGRTQVSKKPLEAMKNAEEALALNVKNSQALSLLADAARNAEALFITVEALEAIHDIDPKNEATINKLADVYKETKQGSKLLAIAQRLAALHPGSLEHQAALREAAALATISDGEWENGDKSAVNKAQDQAPEKQGGDKIIRAEEDIQEAIASYEKQIEEGNDSIDLRRKLAEFYFTMKRYEDAINAYNWIVEKMGTLDPAIDKGIEKANVAIGLQNIEMLKASGASEDEIKEQEKEIYDYKLERYEDRMKNYPNDLNIRYELAELYWEGNAIDNALEQFQLAQRNPQKRLQAIVYLGRCFHVKGQNDMAIEQFNKALSDMHTMDKDKMNTLYHLGVTYEEMGEIEKAMDCFKQIYSSDITYLDVKERMDKFYASK